MSSSQRKSTKPTKPTKTTKATKKKSAPPLIAIPPAGCYVPQPVDPSMAFGQYSPNLGMQQQLVNNWLHQSSSPSLESLSQFTPESQFLRNTPRRLEQENSDDDEEETEEAEVEEEEEEEEESGPTDKGKAPSLIPHQRVAFSVPYSSVIINFFAHPPRLTFFITCAPPSSGTPYSGDSSSLAVLDGGKSSSGIPDANFFNSDHGYGKVEFIHGRYIWGNDRNNLVSLNSDYGNGGSYLNNPSSGFTGIQGGIISFWDPSVFHVSLVIKNHFFLAVAGNWNGIWGETIFVNVYAPQAPAKKRSLWDKLLNLVNSRHGNWIFLGDFNAVRRPDERFNSNFCPRIAYDFNAFISNAGLLDLKMTGRRFTYFCDVGCKLSKLDRFLVSTSFLSSFPAATVIALPRDLDGFADLVTNTWSSFKGDGAPDRYLVMKLKFLKDTIKAWRRVEYEKETKQLNELKEAVNDLDLQAESRILTDGELAN
ncbi:hypothetical protein LXL04_030088 [Taraxacum kok-saghyz]